MTQDSNTNTVWKRIQKETNVVIAKDSIIPHVARSGRGNFDVVVKAFIDQKLPARISVDKKAELGKFFAGGNAIYNPHHIKRDLELKGESAIQSD